MRAVRDEILSYRYRDLRRFHARLSSYFRVVLDCKFSGERNRHLPAGPTYFFYTPSIFKMYSMGTSGPRGSRSPTASSSACASRVLKYALTRAEAIVAAAFTHNTHTHTHTHTNQHNPYSPALDSLFVRMACKSIRAGIRRLTYYPFHPHPPTLQQIPILFRA